MTSFNFIRQLITLIGVLALPASAVAIPYGTWAPGFFNDPSNPDAQPLADPDGDGLVNLLEYAFATNPTTHNVSPVKEGITENSQTGERFLKLSFPRLPSAQDLTYEVRASNQLG